MTNKPAKSRLIDDLANGADELLTPLELARYLKRDRRWIYDAARSGLIPSLKVGQMLRFRRTEIEAWLNPPTDA